MTQRETELDRARLNPGSVFVSPEQLLRHPGFTKDEKIDLLRRWAYDASELAVAEEEGMMNGESTLQARVLRALHTLSGGANVSYTPPTKHGSV